MDALLSVNWIALLVLIIALLLFKVLNKLAYKINWTFVILISMVMGAVLGIVFASENNSYMTWLALIGVYLCQFDYGTCRTGDSCFCHFRIDSVKR